MANITLCSWNIEVFGPTKFDVRPNNQGMVNFIAATIRVMGANVFVMMEVSTSVRNEIAQAVTQAIEKATGQSWNWQTIAARPAPQLDRESYILFYQLTNVDFRIINNRYGQPVWGLCSLQFPNNFSDENGRRAAYAAFHSTDTNTNWVVTVYHAPPNANAQLGVEAVARSPELYWVDNAGTFERVQHRLLAGDYNIDPFAYPGEYVWLTDPLPVAPPPTMPGYGAGTTAAIHALTHLQRWPNRPPPFWSPNPNDYLDLLLDNIFYEGHAGGGSVFPLLPYVMHPGSRIRVIAESFVLYYPGTANPAFPNADQMMPPLSANLNEAPYAWAVSRFAVSDHLPVQVGVTL